MNNTFIIPTFDINKINEIRDFYNLNNTNQITNTHSYNYGYIDGLNDCNDDSDNSFSSSSDYSSLGLGSNSANSSLHSSVSSLTDLDTTDNPDESFVGGKKRKRKRKNKRKSKKHKKKQRRRTKKGGMDFLTLDIEDINKENITYSKEMPTWLDKENLPKGVRILEGPEKRKVLEESKAINILMKGVYFKIYKDLLDTPEKLDEFIENMFIVIETKYSRDYIKQILNNAKNTDVIKEDPVFYKVYTREEPTGNFGIEDSGIVIERDDIAELKQRGNPFGSRKPKLKTRKRPSDITISSIKGKKAPDRLGNDYRSITPQSITDLPTLGGKRKRKRITRKRKR